MKEKVSIVICVAQTQQKYILYLRRGQLVSATLSRSFFQDISQPWVPGEFSFFVCLRLEDDLEQSIQGGSFWLH